MKSRVLTVKPHFEVVQLIIKINKLKYIGNLKAN